MKKFEAVDLLPLLTRAKQWTSVITGAWSLKFLAFIVTSSILQGAAYNTTDGDLFCRLQILQVVLTSVYLVAKAWEDVAERRSGAQILTSAVGEQNKGTKS